MKKSLRDCWELLKSWAGEISFYSRGQHLCRKTHLRNSQMPMWPFSGCSQPAKQDQSLLSSVPVSPADWYSLLVFFPLHRTGLEAIMETYAFWRPPVRTLTFEDFTTMQKQQGELAKIVKTCRKSRRRGHKSSNALCCVSSDWNGDVTHVVELLAELRGHRAERGMETEDRPCLMGCNGIAWVPWSL